MHTKHILLLTGMLTLSAFADFTATDYTHIKPIKTDSLSLESIVAVPLDAEAYAQLTDNFRDLRVIAETSRETPFTLTKETHTETRTIEKTIPSTIHSLKELPGNSIEIVVKMDKEENVPHFITIHTPLRNYEKHITVYAANTPGQWQEVVRNQVIFDYSRYLDISRNRVLLPSPRARFFKIVVDNVTDLTSSTFMQLTRESRSGQSWSEIGKTIIRHRDFRIDRITFGHYDRKKAAQYERLTDYPATITQTTNNPKSRQTEITIQTNREPLIGFTIQTPSRNFTRNITIQTRNLQAPTPNTWKTIGQGQIQNISFRNTLLNNLSITFPETRAETFRIFIHNQDNPPLTINTITGNGPVYRALFIAQPKSQYALYFGNPEAKHPDYDAATTLNTLQSDTARQPIILQTEATYKNPSYRQTTSFTNILNSKTFLGAAIILVLAGLTYGIIHTLKHINSLPND